MQEVGLADDLEFEYDDADRAWRLRLPPLPVRRLEYRLELHHSGHTEVICDPANPHRAPGGFGDKSVLELPGYRRPAGSTGRWRPVTWRDLTVDRGRSRPKCRCASGRTADAKGILLAHDGGEYDRLIGLVQYSAAMIAAGAMPPHHLVLLSPVERNEWYSANPAYARALVDVCCPPSAPNLAPTHRWSRSAPASARSPCCTRSPYPYLFDGMFLQSGSFFQDRFDAQESNFPWYGRIVRFVADVRRRRRAPHPCRPC